MTNKTKSKRTGLLLRLPRSIHSQAIICAKDDAISLNQWLVSVISMAVARAECGQKAVPSDRLEAIAADEFCGFDACSTHNPKVGICAACDAIYAAREALKSRAKNGVPNA